MVARGVRACVEVGHATVHFIAPALLIPLFALERVLREVLRPVLADEDVIRLDIPQADAPSRDLRARVRAQSGARAVGRAGAARACAMRSSS